MANIVVLLGGFADGPKPLRVPSWIAQGAGRVIVWGAGRVNGVLEVASRSSSVSKRGHKRFRLHPVAGLGIDRHWDVDAPRDPRGGREHLRGGSPFVVLVAERGGDAPTRRGDHRESGCDYGARRRRVPHVRKQEGCAGSVQGPQEVTLLPEVFRLAGSHSTNLRGSASGLMVNKSGDVP
jgi:hypothetical protein